MVFLKTVRRQSGIHICKASDSSFLSASEGVMYDLAPKYSLIPFLLFVLLCELFSSHFCILTGLWALSLSTRHKMRGLHTSGQNLSNQPGYFWQLYRCRCPWSLKPGVCSVQKACAPEKVTLIKLEIKN